MNKYISYFTFLFIFSLVFLMASYTINRSIVEKPNVVRIASLIKTNLPPIAYVNGGNSAVLGTETNLEAAIPTPKQSNTFENKCGEKILMSNSIVNLLKEQNKDFTFNARVKLAKSYNINNYKGSAEQNLFLIKQLYNDKYVICPVLN